MKVQLKDDNTITGESKHSTNFSRSQDFFSRLHCNGSIGFLFANATKIYQSKVRNSKIKLYPLCLGNISKDFTANEKTALNWHVHYFSAGYIIDTSNIIIFHKSLMKKHDVK